MDRMGPVLRIVVVSPIHWAPILTPSLVKLQNDSLEEEKANKKGWNIFSWLVDSTHLKNISQLGSSHQVGVEIKNI